MKTFIFCLTIVTTLTTYVPASFAHTLESIEAWARERNAEIHLIQEESTKGDFLTEQIISIVSTDNPMRESIDPDAFVATQTPIYNQIKQDIKDAAIALG